MSRYVLFLLFTTIFTLFAQTEITYHRTKIKYCLNPISLFHNDTDTILKYYEISNFFFKYSVKNGNGPIFGNGYDEKGTLIAATIGMHYDGIKNARISEIIAKFFKAIVVDETDTIQVKIATVSLKDSTPETELGVTTKSIDEIKTSNTWTSFSFPTSKNTEGKLFILYFQWKPSMNDTIGIIGNDSEKNDGQDENRTRQYFSPPFEGRWRSTL